MGVVRPVMEVYPSACVFLVPIFLISIFTMLNLFIGIMINTMKNLNEANRAREQECVEQLLHADTASADGGPIPSPGDRPAA